MTKISHIVSNLDAAVLVIYGVDVPEYAGVSTRKFNFLFPSILHHSQKQPMFHQFGYF